MLSTQVGREAVEKLKLMLRELQAERMKEFSEATGATVHPDKESGVDEKSKTGGRRRSLKDKLQGCSSAPADQPSDCDAQSADDGSCAHGNEESARTSCHEDDKEDADDIMTRTVASPLLQHMLKAHANSTSSGIGAAEIANGTRKPPRMSQATEAKRLKELEMRIF